MRIATVLLLLFASLPLLAGGDQEPICSSRSDFPTTEVTIDKFDQEIAKFRDAAIIVVCVQFESTVEEGLLNVKWPQVDTYEIWEYRYDPAASQQVWQYWKNTFGIDPPRSLPSDPYLYSLDRYREQKHMFGLWEQTRDYGHPTFIPQVDNFNDLVRYSYQELLPPSSSRQAPPKISVGSLQLPANGF